MTFECDPNKNNKCDKQGCGTTCKYTHNKNYAKGAPTLKEARKKIEGEADERKSKAALKTLQQDRSVLPHSGVAEKAESDTDTGSLSVPGDKSPGETVPESSD